ncbi:MAG: LamG domain-containing protein, partial [Planctomycetota bacterium]
DVNDGDTETYEGFLWQFSTTSAIVHPNMVVWYKFDETSGDDVTDSSGYYNHGEIDDLQGDTWDPCDGRFYPGCITFDNEERIDIEEDVFDYIGESISIAAWWKDTWRDGDENDYCGFGTEDLQMLVRAPDNGDSFIGKTDDFRLYNYELPQDEINKLVRGGEVETAWSPDPYDGEVNVPWDVNVTWKPGDYVAQHKVFFGETWADVNSMTDPCAVQDACEYDPCRLDLQTTYYWRIDEYNDPCTWRGPIWKFTVADFIIIDDFESYNEGDNVIHLTWWEEFLQWPQASGAALFTSYEAQGQPVHSGEQAMKYQYDTDSEWPKDYAVAWLPYDTPMDWKTPGVKMVTLFFYGTAGNDCTDLEQMFVGVEDSDALYAEMRYGDNGVEDMNDINEPEWHRWDIPFIWFSDGNFAAVDADVNFASISKLYIGFGDMLNPVKAGEGTVYFDDIRLSLPMCVPEFADYDLSGDCDVGLADVGVMGMQWLRSDANVSPVTLPSDANLVAHWELDGNADDSTANAYHGTAQGAVSWVTGKVGSGAADFDGGWIVVEDDGNTPKLRIKHYVSVMAWVYIESPGADTKVVIKGEDNEETFGLEVDDEDGAAFIMRDASNPGDVLSVQSGAGAIGGYEWIHIAGTYDQNEQLIYVNGVVEGSETRGAIELFSDPNDGLGIAGRYGDGADFDGTIDDVRVYDRLLTRAEIAWLASDGSGLVELTAKANFFIDDPDPEVINFKDFAILLDHWLDPPVLWPPEPE